MKKIIVVIAAAALAAVAANAQSYKFAHVNFQELVQLMPEMDSARVQLDAASKEAQETLQAMAQEFDNKYSQYEQKSAEWSAAIRQSKERELSEIQSRIQDFQHQVLYVDTAQSTDITPSARESLNIPEDRTLESLQQELQAQAAAAQAAQ